MSNGNNFDWKINPLELSVNSLIGTEFDSVMSQHISMNAVDLRHFIQNVEADGMDDSFYEFTFNHLSKLKEEGNLNNFPFNNYLHYKFAMKTQINQGSIHDENSGLITKEGEKQLNDSVKIDTRYTNEAVQGHRDPISGQLVNQNEISEQDLYTLNKLDEVEMPDGGFAYYDGGVKYHNPGNYMSIGSWYNNKYDMDGFFDTEGKYHSILNLSDYVSEKVYSNFEKGASYNQSSDVMAANQNESIEAWGSTENKYGNKEFYMDNRLVQTILKREPDVLNNRGGFQRYQMAEDLKNTGEPFTDSNQSGFWDEGESFVDENEDGMYNDENFFGRMLVDELDGFTDTFGPFRHNMNRAVDHIAKNRVMGRNGMLEKVTEELNNAVLLGIEKGSDEYLQAKNHIIRNVFQNELESYLSDNKVLVPYWWTKDLSETYLDYNLGLTSPSSGNLGSREAVMFHNDGFKKIKDFVDTYIEEGKINNQLSVGDNFKDMRYSKNSNDFIAGDDESYHSYMTKTESTINNILNWGDGLTFKTNKGEESPIFGNNLSEQQQIDNKFIDGKLLKDRINQTKKLMKYAIKSHLLTDNVHSTLYSFDSGEITGESYWTPMFWLLPYDKMISKVKGKGWTEKGGYRPSYPKHGDFRTSGGYSLPYYKGIYDGRVKNLSQWFARQAVINSEIKLGLGTKIKRATSYAGRRTLRSPRLRGGAAIVLGPEILEMIPDIVNGLWHGGWGDDKPTIVDEDLRNVAISLGWEAPVGTQGYEGSGTYIGSRPIFSVAKPALELTGWDQWMLGMDKNKILEIQRDFSFEHSQAMNVYDGIANSIVEGHFEYQKEALTLENLGLEIDSSIRRNKDFTQATSDEERNEVYNRLFYERMKRNDYQGHLKRYLSASNSYLGGLNLIGMTRGQTSENEIWKTMTPPPAFFPKELWEDLHRISTMSDDEYANLYDGNSPYLRYKKEGNTYEEGVNFSYEYGKWAERGKHDWEEGVGDIHGSKRTEHSTSQVISTQYARLGPHPVYGSDFDYSLFRRVSPNKATLLENYNTNETYKLLTGWKNNNIIDKLKDPTEGLESSFHWFLGTAQGEEEVKKQKELSKRMDDILFKSPWSPLYGKSLKKGDK